MNAINDLRANINGCIDFLNPSCYLAKAWAAITNNKTKDLKLEIGILSNGEGYTTPRVIKKLENAKNVKTEIKIIRYDSKKDDDELSLEVLNALNCIKEKGYDKLYGSRAEAFIALVKNGTINAPKSLEIINEIQEKTKTLDAIFLPGGENIPKIWYQDEVSGLLSQQYRSLVELTLINEARKRGIPIMAVCRGFQILNVYNGKKLEQNVPNQFGIQHFDLIEKNKKGLLPSIFEKKVSAQVMHYQGVSIEEGTNGKGELEPLTQACGLIKAVESKYAGASPIIGTQFHPELHSSKSDARTTSNNETFFSVLFQGATNKHQKMQITPDSLNKTKLKLKKIVNKNMKELENTSK